VNLKSNLTLRIGRIAREIVEKLKVKTKMTVFEKYFAEFLTQIRQKQRVKSIFRGEIAIFGGSQVIK
jgi:hypothetical protein